MRRVGGRRGVDKFLCEELTALVSSRYCRCPDNTVAGEAEVDDLSRPLRMQDLCALQLGIKHRVSPRPAHHSENNTAQNPSKG